MEPPLIREHGRVAEDIAADVTTRLGFDAQGVDVLQDALVRVFARFCEIIVERLNRIPETYHRVFLDMLGLPARPAVPAVAYLCFTATVASGAAGPERRIVVRERTRVAASGGSAEAGPVTFETTRDIELVRAELERAVAVGAQGQLVAERDAVVLPEGFAGSSMLADARPMPRVAHFELPAILGLPGLSTLHIEVTLGSQGAAVAPPGVEWGIPTKDGFLPLAVERDTTRGLAGSGEVVIRPPPSWPRTTISRIESRWLSCRVMPGRAAANVPPWRPPAIVSLSLAAEIGHCPSAVEGASWMLSPLDISRDFFPLGEHPRFGETFQVRSALFLVPEARVVLRVKLTNPAGATDSPIRPVGRQGKPRLTWEIGAAHGWRGLDVTDGTNALTRDGDIVFSVPDEAAAVTLAGKEGGWVRARLTSGAYVGADPPPLPGLPAPGAPPSIASLAVMGSVGPVPPARVVIESGLECIDLGSAQGQSFQSFPLVAPGFALYLGLRASARDLAGHTLSFYGRPADAEAPVVFGAIDDTPPPRWQVRSPVGWSDCRVEDETRALREPGMVKVTLPQNVDHWSGTTLEARPELFWMRILWDGPLPREPCLRRLALNAVPALQATTLNNELIGSSSGRPNQQFRSARAPMLGEVLLEVREGLPSPGPGRTVPDDPRRDIVLPARAAPRGPNERWLPWTCVDDFAHSDERARHVTADRLTGTIRFGDGRHGVIPPRGGNNLRLREYRTGGGRHGNLPPATITQLQTTVPYVQGVANPEPSVGGQDAEDEVALRRRAGPWLRHRGRAVCADDYADLALQASPDVAKTICVPARDLARDRTGRLSSPGVVTLLIVPQSDAPCPLPSLELLRRISDDLTPRKPLGVNIVPARERASVRVIAECERRLQAFLHPVSGGRDGRGWEFGQRPHASDFYPVVGEVEGVDDIRSLSVHMEKPRQGPQDSRFWLVCAGAQSVTAWG